MAECYYVPHIRQRGETPVPKSKRTYPPRRWVIERTFAWLSKCRALLVAKGNQRRSLAGIQSLQYVLDAGSSPV